MSTLFFPSKHSTKLLTDKVNNLLRCSMLYLLEEMDAQLQVDTLAERQYLRDVNKEHKFPSRMFGINHFLLQALEEGHYDMARKIVKTIPEVEHVRSSDIMISNYSLDYSGDAFLTIDSLFVDDFNYDLSVIFSPCIQSDFITSSKRITCLLSKIESYDYELYDNIASFMSEILLVTMSKKSPFVMESASAFNWWGSVVINIHARHDDWFFAEAILHETAHLYLYAMALDESLVLNPSAEKYASPLRKDKRSMDGIYHATFVSARMHYGLNQIRKMPFICDEQKSELDSRLNRHMKNYHDGLSTIENHGQLSNLGESIVESMRNYMESVNERKV